MRILITGVAGFIGSHLADRFIADGHQVVGLDNLLTGRLENVHEDVDYFNQDVRRIAEVTAASGSPDLIVHCAASYANPDKWHRDTDTNITGTINTILEARVAGCPLVYMQTALPPRSSYAISKTAGMQYIQQSGVPHLVFRLANIYGPRNLSGPIPTFYKRLTEGLPCTVVDTTRDMVYVQDLVDCVMLALSQMAAGTFDVCSGTQTSIADLFTAVDMALETVTQVVMVKPASDEAMTELNPDRRIPGWEATTEMLTGVANAVDWYRENPPTQTFTHLRLEEPTRA